MSFPAPSAATNLRAQARDGICPECETPVEKAIELAAVSLRPAWRDSDPRWRRRMIAGVWIMVLIPLVAALHWSGLAATLWVPALFGYASKVRPLEDSFVTMVYPYLAFCIGVALFFSKERDRRHHPLDWTRRWGVIVSYLVLLLGVPTFGLVSALVMVGIAALFMSMPLANQPQGIELLRQIGSAYIYYGPQDDELAYVALAASSAGAVLLACVPLYEALRSSRRTKSLALVVLVPLGLISVWQIWCAVRWYLVRPPLANSEPLAFFLAPDVLVLGIARLAGLEWAPAGWIGWISPPPLAGEIAKGLIFLTIAIWLTIAQVRAWRKLPIRRAQAP